MNRSSRGWHRCVIVLGLLGGVHAFCGAQPGTVAGQTTAAAPPPAQRPTALVPDPARLGAASPELRARLAGDAFSYFRFLNTSWAQRVCDAFARDLPSLPSARLHGDAHVEQYAFTSTARGLDDFDDSAFGPAVVDLVRFLGSAHLAARSRGWQASTSRLFDEFLDGYRKGLTDRDYLPGEPAVVRRLRASRTRDSKAFLAWADSLMGPVDPADLPGATESLTRVAGLLRKVRRQLPEHYFRLKRIGWLTVGVGSALTPKVLARVEGPTSAPDDDVVLEAKQLSDLHGVSCLTVPTAGAAFRVITATEQLGRIEHGILAIVPRPPLRAASATDWWVRSWDPSYVEITVADYASVEELAEVVHDAGAQLGTGGLRETGVPAERQERQTEFDALVRLEPRVRAVAQQLARELVEQWEGFKAREATTGSRRP